jgi:glycine dehydrogenase subunit 2
MSGMRVVELPSDERGNIDLDALRASLTSGAGLMLTNPNTLGLFEENVEEVIDIIHEAGGLVYGDGANMNALLGIVRPGDLGSTCCTTTCTRPSAPRTAAAGPARAPVGVAPHLVDFLPDPIVVGVDPDPTRRTRPCTGSSTRRRPSGGSRPSTGTSACSCAPTPTSACTAARACAVSEYAVLNANYLLANLRDTYHLPYDRVCMHEFVLEGRWPEAPDVHALDIAKRLMDFRFHPPTNYFPLIVHEALMIEPTETESKETLDAFAEAMIKIAEEAHTDPEVLKTAPHDTPYGRMDEVRAAKALVLCCVAAYEQKETAELEVEG